MIIWFSIISLIAITLIVVAVESSAQLFDTSLALEITGHELSSFAHNFVFVDLHWDPLYPLSRRQLECQGSNEHSSSSEEALAELLSIEDSSVKDEPENTDLASSILDPKDYHKNQQEWNAIEELFEDVVLIGTDHSAVDCVEELHKHESGEDDSQVDLFVFCECLLLAFVFPYTVYLWASVCRLGVLLIVEAVDGSSKPNHKEHHSDHPHCNTINLSPDSLG